MRHSDLNKLVYYFLNKCHEEGLEKKYLSEEAINELKKYKWPGNIRELENFIRRLVVLIPSNKITNNDIIKNLSRSNTLISELNSNNSSEKISLSLSVEKHLKMMSHFGKVRMLGAASNSLLQVAKGAAEIYSEKEIMLWDVAAGLAIVKGAGGEFNIKQGNAKNAVNVVASNGLINMKIAS